MKPPKTNIACLYCKMPRIARGLCDKHYTRWKTGIPLDAPDRYRCSTRVKERMKRLYLKGFSGRQVAAKLEYSPTQVWRVLHSFGIVRTQAEAQPFTSKNPESTRYQARKIWCKHNGLARTPKGWHVHHKDLDPTNNEIDNLVLMLHGDHMKLHRKLEKISRQQHAKA